MPFAVSWRGQRAGSRDYCGQNKEQPRKDTIAIPPICQGPAWSYLLDLTPSHQCPHSPCPVSCQASKQSTQRLRCDVRGGSGEGETRHQAWGILSPWAGTLPAARQHMCLSTIVKQEQVRDRMSRDRPDSDQERCLSRGSTPLPAHHPPGAETTRSGNRGCRNHTAHLGLGSKGRKVPWQQSCTLQVEKKKPT